MPRLIKFRGVRVDNGEFVFGDLLQKPTCRIVNEDGEFEIKPESVAQYVGLDGEDREIYTGDRVADMWWRGGVEQGYLLPCSAWIDYREGSIATFRNSQWLKNGLEVRTDEHLRNKFLIDENGDFSPSAAKIIEQQKRELDEREEERIKNKSILLSECAEHAHQIYSRFRYRHPNAVMQYHVVGETEIITITYQEPLRKFKETTLF